MPKIYQYIKKRQDILLKDAEKRVDELYLTIDPKKILKISFVLSIVMGLLAALITDSLIPGIAVSCLIIIIPFCLTVVSKKRRQKELNKQLPGIIEKLSSAIKAGNNLKDAFEKIGAGAEGPFGQEALHVVKEIRLGLSLEEALTRMSGRIKSEDISIFCTALIIAINTGGNISEMLENIAHSIREKRTLEGKIKALTSQGKMQGIIVGLIPFVLLTILYFLDPGMIKPLFESTIGKILLAGGLILKILGMIVIMRIVDIKY